MKTDNINLWPTWFQVIVSKRLCCLGSPRGPNLRSTQNASSIIKIEIWSRCYKTSYLTRKKRRMKVAKHKRRGGKAGTFAQILLRVKDITQYKTCIKHLMTLLIYFTRYYRWQGLKHYFDSINKVNLLRCEVTTSFWEPVCLLMSFICTPTLAAKTGHTALNIEPAEPLIVRDVNVSRQEWSMRHSLIQTFPSTDGFPCGFRNNSTTLLNPSLIPPHRPPFHCISCPLLLSDPPRVLLYFIKSPQ